VNTPHVICRIFDDEEDAYKLFSTLNKALEYAASNLDGRATIEMLTDYVIPATDALEISESGYDITLTSKTGENYTIYRDSEFVNAAMFTNYGSMTLTNIIINGRSMDGSDVV